MDEDEDRRIGAVSSINIELFNLSWSVCSTLRRADAGAHGLTVASETIRDLPDERFVVRLIVRGIEFELIVIQEYQRALVMLRWTNLTPFSQSRRGSHCDGRCEHRSTAD